MSYLNDIIEFAIQREQEAAEYYRDLAGKMQSDLTREVFLGFAREEEAHEEKLRLLQRKDIAGAETLKIDRSRMKDLMRDLDADEVDSYKAALAIALAREESAYQLYDELARLTAAETELSGVFRALALEEMSHKRFLEGEYAKHVGRKA